MLLQLATVPPNEAKSRFSLRLRLEELTAYMNYLTGGLYHQQLEQLEAEGWLPPSLMDELIQQHATPLPRQSQQSSESNEPKDPVSGPKPRPQPKTQSTPSREVNF